jgi:ATP-binding cassette subfamily B protein
MMSVGVLIVWLVGGGQVLGATLKLGTLLMFITYMQQFYNPVQQLLNLNQAFQDTATAAERIFSIMDMPSDVADHDKAAELGEVRGHIEFRDVSFKYADGERILKNINLSVRPGEMIGLVGETCSGKSTLVSLVCRFYEPEKGRVTLDDTDLRDIRTKSLRSNIGMVLQDAFLFAGTISENIAYGRPDATDVEIIRAAKAANAHDFIMNLPDGYDSRVGERGVGLSGGGPRHPHPGRGHLRRGHRHRGLHPGGDGPPRPRTHHHRHRAPPLHPAQRRPAGRPQGRRDHRRGHPQGADGKRRRRLRQPGEDPGQVHE